MNDSDCFTDYRDDELIDDDDNYDDFDGGHGSQLNVIRSSTHTVHMTHLCHFDSRFAPIHHMQTASML